jgi:hypothetical protein
MTELSHEDRKFVKDQEQVCLKAVFENVEWLREMNITETPEEIARTYRLVYLNRHLREASFESDQDFPSFTVALDEGGNFLGSFLDH